MLSRFAGNEEQSIAQLRRYWDALVNGGPATPCQTGLDPELAATVRQLHRQDEALGASAEFAARLLDQLTGEPKSMQTGSIAAGAGLPRPTSVAPLVPAAGSKCAPARAGVSRAWAAISAGSVVLILLAIVAGAFIWNANREPVPAIIPLYSETTADGVLIQTLLEEHVAADMLPGDPTKWIASFKFGLEPGEAWRDTPSPCQLSRQYVVGLVESGTLAMVNTGPFEVTRSDGTKESIPAGERADLQAGDSWVYLSDRTETNVQKWNPGTVPMVAFQTDWALDESCEPVPVNPEWHWHDSVYAASFEPSRPVVATFKQVFVQPGAMISSDDAARIGFASDKSVVFSVIGIESGTLHEAWIPNALIEAETPGADPDQRYTFKAGQVWSNFARGSLSEGMEQEFRAGDDEPLELTVISWSYDEGGSTSDAVEPSSETTVIQLLEESFAAGVIPADSVNLIDNARYLLEPGESWRYRPSTCRLDPSLNVGLIESGILSLTATGPFEVIRGEGTRESIPAGEEALLYKGDRWIYISDSTETYAGKRNGGTEPVEIVESIWGFSDSCNVRPEDAERLWSGWQYAYDFDSSRPIVATVERATVPPGAQLTPDEIQRLGLGTSEQDVFRMIAVESGTLEEVWVPDALAQSESAQLETDNKRTVESGEVWTLQTSLAPPEGWAREFRNPSDEPLVLTIVAWSYDEAQDAGDPPDGPAAGDIERKAVIDHHFAADAAPRDNASMFVMNRALVPPGDSVAYPSSCGAPTLMATAVESGVYTIRAESRIDVTRADGTVATIEPATPVELAAGDSFIYENATGESLSEFRNAGSEPLALLQAIWFPEAGCTYGQVGSEDRSQIVWITYDRLPALEAPRAFDLNVQNVVIPNSFPLLDEEITGFAIPQFPNDNLARMAIESGTVIDNVAVVTGNVREQIFTERYGTAAVLSLDNPLALGDNFERRLTPLGPGGPTGEEPVEVTLFSLIYAPDTG